MLFFSYGSFNLNLDLLSCRKKNYLCIVQMSTMFLTFIPTDSRVRLGELCMICSLYAFLTQSELLSNESSNLDYSGKHKTVIQQLFQTIQTLNVRGIRTFKKRKSMFNWLIHVKQDSDICFLQETYSTA